MNKRMTLSALAVSSILLVSGCGSSTTISEDPNAASFGTIKISEGVSNETKVVAYLYAEALHQAGYSTEVVDTGTDRATYLEQLKESLQPTAATASSDANTLDVVPDYSGELLMYLTNDGAFSVSYLQQEEAKASETASPSAPETTFTATPTPIPTATTLNVTSLNSSDIHSSIQSLLPQGLSLLNASDADPKHALYVTKLTAAVDHLEELSDLTELCTTLTFDMAQSYENSTYIKDSLQQTYKCSPKKFNTDSNQSARAQNLVTDKAQVADLRVTTPEVEDNGLLSLRDPSNIFISQNITPIIRTSEMPESAQKAINTVSSKLTNSELTQLTKLTSGDGAVTYENAAKFWLSQSQE